MNPFQDFKTEIKLFLIVAFVAVSVGGILLVKSSQQPLVFPQEPKIVSGDIQVEPKDQMCTTDIDCERIWTDCAGCSCGAAVNKGQVERYQISKGEICKDYNGPVCEFYCETPSPRCVNNKCILSSKKYAEKIAAWKTYRNEEYGFEFQSPARRIELFPASSADYLYEDREFYGIYGISNQDYAARIDVYPDTPLAVVLQDNRFINTARVLSEITKNSILWTKVEDSDYLFEKNKMTYHIAGEQDLTAPILSTFRFTK